MTADAARSWEVSSEWDKYWCANLAVKLASLPTGLTNELYVAAASTLWEGDTDRRNWGKTNWLSFVFALHQLCGYRRPANPKAVHKLIWVQRKSLAAPDGRDIDAARATLISRSVEIIGGGQAQVGEWAAFANRLAGLPFERALQKVHDFGGRPKPSLGRLYAWALDLWRRCADAPGTSDPLAQVGAWIAFLAAGDWSTKASKATGVCSKHRRCGRLLGPALFDLDALGAGKLLDAIAPKDKGRYCALAVFCPRIGHSGEGSHLARLERLLVADLEEFAYKTDHPIQAEIIQWFAPHKPHDLTTRLRVGSLLVELVHDCRAPPTEARLANSVAVLVDEMVNLTYPGGNNVDQRQEWRANVKVYLRRLFRRTAREVRDWQPWEISLYRRLKALADRFRDPSL